LLPVRLGRRVPIAAEHEVRDPPHVEILVEDGVKLLLAGRLRHLLVVERLQGLLHHGVDEAGGITRRGAGGLAKAEADAEDENEETERAAECHGPAFPCRPALAPAVAGAHRWRLLRGKRRHPATPPFRASLAWCRRKNQHLSPGMVGREVGRAPRQEILLPIV